MELPEVDQKALEAIKSKNADDLRDLNFHPRVLINALKNSLEDLEFLLKVLDGRDPGAGTYFYENISDKKTFDLYLNYGISPSNLFKELMKDPEQWDYLLKIGYITKKQHRKGWA